MENIKKHLFSSRSTGNDSRSVFHVSANTNEATSQEVQDCCESIEEFHNAVRNLVGAGTHLTETLTKALKDSSYQCVGDEFAATFREVYSCTQMARWADQMKEMGTLLLNLKEKLDDNRMDDLNKLSAQTYCHVLMLFLRMQKGYHHFCDEKLDALVSRLCDDKGTDSQKEITKQLLGVLVTNETVRPDSRSNSNSPSSSPRASPKPKDEVGASSHKTQRTFRSSLLSLFERKPSPEERKSAFYVDMNQDVAGCITDELVPQAAGSLGSNAGDSQTMKTAETTAESPTTTDSTPSSTADSGSVDLLGHGPMTAGSQSGVPLIGVGVQDFNVAGHNLQFGPSANFLTTAGLASEEELESVINLLSGVNTSNSPMQVIPEHLAVPPIYRMPSPSASDSQAEEMSMPRVQHHRRSESSLDLSGMGRNTWPHMHRSSLPTIQPFIQRQYADQHRDTTMLMRPPLPDSYRNNAGYMLPGALNSQCSGMQLGYPGGWPNKQSSDTMTSGWSGVQDSSDLSDDSSSGEQFYTVSRDFVQAIETKDDSSDDEFDKDRRKQQGSAQIAGMEVQNNCSINTWLSKPWSQSNQFLSSDVPLLEASEEPLPTHRPVQMQWSDPMSTRRMWPTIAPGFTPQRTSQSMQGFGNLQ
ncbi:uncharacterized protein LOC121389375 [Gigantopelta aegis]|uniref:uncharacterized protein LOC121389375 n=1 Tax=Gigantopelta aegis TaxID=1735272 RepID=UPI001B888B47|nr:uncharacterized protein LOC121389375 [Gigantopelta aegis]XP_041376905.1 uncharacterized protein LOC121389375 [Gigantopelta aegis]